MKKKLLKVSMFSIISITAMLSFASYAGAKNTNSETLYLAATTNMPNNNNSEGIQQQDMPSNGNMNEVEQNGTQTSNNPQDPKTKNTTDNTASQELERIPQDKVQETM